MSRTSSVGFTVVCISSCHSVLYFSVMNPRNPRGLGSVVCSCRIFFYCIAPRRRENFEKGLHKRFGGSVFLWMPLPIFVGCLAQSICDKSIRIGAFFNL